MHSFLHLLLQYNHSIHKSIRWLYWTEFRTSWVAWRRHLDTITQLLTGVRVHFQNLGEWLVLICGIYCIEVAIHLVPKGEPSLLGKICLRTTQAAPTVALTDCRCCWAETWLWLCFWYRRFFKKQHWIVRTRIGKIQNCHIFNIIWRVTDVSRRRQISLNIKYITSEEIDYISCSMVKHIQSISLISVYIFIIIQKTRHWLIV